VNAFGRSESENREFPTPHPTCDATMEVGSERRRQPTTLGMRDELMVVRVPVVLNFE
jgi:hypothetical protein